MARSEHATNQGITDELLERNLMANCEAVNYRDLSPATAALKYRLSE